MLLLWDASCVCVCVWSYGVRHEVGLYRKKTKDLHLYVSVFWCFVSKWKWNERPASWNQSQLLKCINMFKTAAHTRSLWTDWSLIDQMVNGPIEPNVAHFTNRNYSLIYARGQRPICNLEMKHYISASPLWRIGPAQWRAAIRALLPSDHWGAGACRALRVDVLLGSFMSFSSNFSLKRIQ